MLQQQNMQVTSSFHGIVPQGLCGAIRLAWRAQLKIKVEQQKEQLALMEKTVNAVCEPRPAMART